MPVDVSFVFRPGVPAVVFSEVRLSAYWDERGAASATPTLLAMDAVLDEAGCPAFQAKVSLPAESMGRSFRWGVRAKTRDGSEHWLIVAGVNEDGQFFREFTLGADGQTEAYDLTLCRQLGANATKSPGSGSLHTRFRVWAPNARAVDLTLANPFIGYVANDGSGAVRSIPMARDDNGIWSTGDDPALAEAGRTYGKPYMYRIAKDDGSVAYRTDLFSRAQIGHGSFDPQGKPYGGLPSHLDGTKSCSLVRDPDRILDDNGDLVAAEDFWADEFDLAKPLPTNTEDLVIYELHVGALGFGRPDSGTLNDALAFVDYLAELGVNAAELLPISEFQGEIGWGYSTSHFCAIEGSIGGADRLKHFVRACHRRGIAVILDVVYNHYDGDAERAEWQFDSNAPERNIYYWYEGTASDYNFPEGGYIDNESTGWAPRFDEEMVRQLFISSAAAFVTDFHVDGFRVDQTTSIHAYAKLHANGQPADRAKAAGVAFLRQWTQTLRLIRPGLFLTAEDHSGWENVTKPYDQGGLGFDAAWYSDFYHHLVDFGEGGANWAKLLRTAGYGDSRPLAMSFFAGALRASGSGKVVYNDSHDEAGNSPGSARTICLAVNNAPLVGATRSWAEARVRVAAGLALLSAGTPMFFMGEEVGAQKPYRYDDFLQHREDILDLSRDVGRFLFAYYRDLIALGRGTPAMRSRTIDVFLADDSNRLIAFRRWDERDEFLVVASFNPQTFDKGYRMSHPNFAGKSWLEIFNSDGKAYGGAGIGNAGAALTADGSTLNPIVPATGIIVLRAQKS